MENNIGKYIQYGGLIEKIERETKTQLITKNGRYNKKTKRPIGFVFYWNAPDVFVIINEEEKNITEKRNRQQKELRNKRDYIIKNM